MTHTALIGFIERHPRLFVLTGAGCSTESGIPDYRDADGAWKRGHPVMLQDFLTNAHARRRYWARSLVGWRRIRTALPNSAHRSLARLERRGRITQLVTQNVDGLHQAAGSRKVIDLHGRVDVVRCMVCERRVPRETVQADLVRRNPEYAALDAPEAILALGLEEGRVAPGDAADELRLEPALAPPEQQLVSLGPPRAKERLDPAGVMNPGKLLPNESGK